MQHQWQCLDCGVGESEVGGQKKGTASPLGVGGLSMYLLSLGEPRGGLGSPGYRGTEAQRRERPAAEQDDAGQDARRRGLSTLRESGTSETRSRPSWVPTNSLQIVLSCYCYNYFQGRSMSCDEPAGNNCIPGWAGPCRLPSVVRGANAVGCSDTEGPRRKYRPEDAPHL